MAGIQKEKRESSNIRMLEAALTEFSEFGFSGARITSIAKKAGVSQGLLSQRFLTKEDLYLEVAKNELDYYKNNLLDTNSLRSSFEGLIGLIKKAASERREGFRFASRYFQSQDIPRSLNDRIWSNFKSSSFSKLLEFHMKQGTLPKEDPLKCFSRFARIVFTITECFVESGTSLPMDEYYLRLIGLSETATPEEQKVYDVNSTVFRDFSTDYYVITLLNLSSGNVNLIKAPSNKKKDLQKVLRNGFPGLVDYLLENYVLPEDRERFLQEAKTDSIAKRLEKDNTFYSRYRLKIGDVGQFFQIKVISDSQRLGADNILIGCTNVDVEVRAEEERQTILNSLTRDYIAIFNVDLNKGSFGKFQLAPEVAQILSGWSNIEDYDYLVQLFSDRMIAKEDRVAFLEKMSSETVTDTLKHSEVYTEDFHLMWKQKRELCQFKFIRLSEDGCRFLVGIQSLDYEEKLLYERSRSLAIISELAEDYECIDYVSFLEEDSHQNVTVYRGSDWFNEAIPEWGTTMSYAKRTQLMCDAMVIPQDRERFLRMMKLSTVKKNLKENPIYYVNYKMKNGEAMQFFQIKFSASVVDDHMIGFVLGLRNADEDTRNAINHNRELENAVASRTVELSEKNKALGQMNDETVELFSDVVEVRDKDSISHTRRVKKFTHVLAEMVRSYCPEYHLSADDVNRISAASAFHDIGKILIPDAILFKPGKLTPDEFELVKTHCEKGCSVLNKAPRDWSDEYSETIRDICAYHHERWDGRGYPKGLKGDEIPISAQIVSVADCFDAMTAKRAYGEAYRPEVALEMILNGECGAFSEKLMNCLNRCRDEYIAHATSEMDESMHYSPMNRSNDVLMNIRVLLAEDNDFSRELEKEMLESEGATVVDAENGQVAMKLFAGSEQKAFDLVLMDVNMPIMNGIETIRKIRSMDSNYAKTVPIILLTANTESGDIFDALAAGADTYVNKPLVISQLANKYLASIKNRSETMAATLSTTVEMANTDPLTGVRNITAYTECVARLSEKIRTGEHTKFALVECDINGLKTTNDTYGHDVGDLYINNCCSLLRRVFKKSELYRIGGDEFVVILENEDYENRVLLTEFLKKQVENTSRLSSVEAGRANLAVGMAEYVPGEDSSITSVFKRADQAMYEDKQKSPHR